MATLEITLAAPSARSRPIPTNFPYQTAAREWLLLCIRKFFAERILPADEEFVQLGYTGGVPSFDVTLSDNERGDLSAYAYCGYVEDLRPHGALVYVLDAKDNNVGEFIRAYEDFADNPSLRLIVRALLHEQTPVPLREQY